MFDNSEDYDINAPRFYNPKYGRVFLENKTQYKEFMGDFARKIVVRASKYILVTLKENYIKKYAYMHVADKHIKEQMQRDRIAEKARELGNRAKENYISSHPIDAWQAYGGGEYRRDVEARFSGRRAERNYKSRAENLNRSRRWLREDRGMLYERTWEFLNSWFAERPKKSGTTYTTAIKYNPTNVMHDYPEKWGHYSNLEGWKGSSKYTLADILNVEGPTSRLLWNYRSVAYWDAFKKDYRKIAAKATKQAFSEYETGGYTAKTLPPVHPL